MEQHILKTAVLFCIIIAQVQLLVAAEPVSVIDMTSITPVEENPDNPLTATEKTPILVHAITPETTVTTPPAGPAIDKQEGSWLSKLFYRSSAVGPSLVVEVDDATNDASLRIMHLPLVRHQRNNTLMTTVVKEVNATTTHHQSKRQAPMNPRELKFRIFDRRIVQALINAYVPIDPYRASLMQANVHRLMIKVALDEEGEWLKHYGFALRDLPFVVPGGMPGTPIPPQRKRRSLPVAEVEPTEAVKVEPTEAVEVEPIEAVEVEPTEAVEVEPQEPVEVEPTEAAEVEPTKKTKKAKPKRAVKNTKATEVEPQEQVEVEPQEPVEVEPQEPVEVEPTEAAEVEPQEPVEPVEPTKNSKGKAKRAVKTKTVNEPKKEAEVEPEAKETEVEVEPGMKVSNKKPVQSRANKDRKKQQEKEEEQEQKPVKKSEEKPKKKQQQEQEQTEQEQEPVEKEQKKKSKKQKRQAVEQQPQQGEVETVTQTPVKPTTPVVVQSGVTPFNPFACNALCQQQGGLQPVCATNGFCVHEFPSPCSLKIYSCKHPQLGFQIMNQGQCIYTANVPRCIDLLVAQ